MRLLFVARLGDIMSDYDPDEVLTPASPNLPQLPEGWRYGPALASDTKHGGWPLVVYPEGCTGSRYVVWMDKTKRGDEWRAYIGPAESSSPSASVEFPTQREALDVALTRVLLGMWRD